MPEINWYPGHMAKSKRLLIGQLKLVDAIIELCDARAPIATRNPDLNAMTAGKSRILVLNKADLANDVQTKNWLNYFRSTGQTALKFNSNGGSTRELLRAIEDMVRPKVERMKARGANKTVRLMVIGIPNVGKSSFINRLYGANIAKAQDRPGVTRSNQWVKVGPYLELLDTPGLLWPKLENQKYARILAFLGSIRDQIMDTEALAGELLKQLLTIDQRSITERFKLPESIPRDTPIETLLVLACQGRGWLLSGGRFDTERAAALVLDEFRAGKVGKITLELCKR